MSSKVELSCFQPAGAALWSRGPNRKSEGGGISRKETTDPMEVERQLRGLMACFKCVAADLCV